MTKDFTQKDLFSVVNFIKDGKVVAFPTDTVYGVGVRYDDEQAIARMKWAKGRPESKPFPLMVCDVLQLQQIAWVDEDIYRIVKHLTPGPLTLVLNKKEHVPDAVTNGKSTIAVRIPDHRFVLDLLESAGPMLVTSANLSDHPSCKTYSEVMEQLDGRIDAIVDGPCGSGIASTIVDVTEKPYKILREGTISLNEIMEVLKK
ncbi:MAG: threonylcarbamoyl-AMP synthase [Erysipelotrichaceae bacterium]|nr:threonylcarbamoyl-AMP synthase [Erysipelotrichaceae bacterium]